MTGRRRALVATATLVAALGVSTALSALESSHHGDTCDGDTHRNTEQRPQKRGRFEALEDVSLSPKVEEKLNAIADKYRKRTNKTFVVTSGTRDPDTQAELIHDKLVAGDDLLKLYKDKSAVSELIKVFDEAKAAKKTRSQVVVLIAATIRAQMKRGIYISAHLKAGAADVRSTTMTPSDKRAFAEIAKDHGLAVMLEATPPHFHLQLE